MRKGILIVVFFAMLFSLVIAAGCGNDITIQTPQGSAHVEEGNGDSSKITIEEGDESATLEKTQEAPSEEELGAPIYPGAEFDAENSGIVHYSGGEGSAFAGTARFVSDDSFGEVVDFYKAKIGEPASSTSTSADWLLGDLSTGNYTAVHIEADDGQTKIDISRMSASV